MEELGAEGYRMLLESIPGARFFIKDSDGRYVFASRPMFLAHGFRDASELIGHFDREFIPHYLADHYIADDREVLQGAQILGRVELVTRHRGCPDWYLTSKTALRSREGRIVGLLGVSRHLDEAVRLPSSYAELAPVIACIRERFTESLELDVLARLSQLSLRSFQRRFNKVFHVAPMEYLRQFRVGRACQLLVETNATVTAVASECGFCDHSHLVREFRRLLGASPGEYRKRYQAI